MNLSETYPKSVQALTTVLGEKEKVYEKIEPYLHVYDGTAKSVKPIAKHITIYWLGRAADRMVIRTEGEDDIILSQVKDEAVPTIIFRKIKAVVLRRFMQIARKQWELYGEEIKKVAGYDQSYNFIEQCSIAVGIRGEEKGALHGRCMMCPVDVLMGATSGGALYNLVSRFVGDSAYALTPSFERRTGNAVNEVTYTTIMMTKKMETAEEERRTGALYTETHVEPGTIFVGKIVLPMISPPELIHVLWLLYHPLRIGARTSIQGTLEVHPVAMIGDAFEVGTAYEVAERLVGTTDLKKAREGVLEYLEKEAKFSSASPVILLDETIRSKIKELDILDKELVLELWRNAKRYVDGVRAYISQ